MRWHVRLYLRLIGASMRSQLQYRVSFAFDLLGAFLITFLDFLAIAVLFSHLPRLAGWSFVEVAFFYGIANVAFALTDLAVGHLDWFPRMVRDGSFDLVLIRPLGSLFQVISSDFALRRLGRVAQGLVVLVVAVSWLHVPWTPLRGLMLLSMLVTGPAIFASIWIVGSVVAFWTVEIREVTNAFTYGGSYLASYPINIFSGWLRRLLAFVVPTAFVAYFPGAYVMAHPDPLGTPVFVPFLTPLVAVVMLFLAYGTWQWGVRHYRSTGS